MRPLVNGKLGPNAPLANLLARVLRAARSGMSLDKPTAILSTEELLHYLSQFNREIRQIPREQPRRGCKTASRIQSNQYIVGSMDVKALYPSCRVGETVKMVEDAIKSCGLKFKDIDRRFLYQWVSVLT